MVVACVAITVVFGWPVDWPGDWLCDCGMCVVPRGGCMVQEGWWGYRERVGTLVEGSMANGRGMADGNAMVHIILLVAQLGDAF